MFRFLRLPVATVLSSMNEVNNGYLSGLDFDEKLCSKIEEINRTKPEQYKKLSLIRK